MALPYVMPPVSPFDTITAQETNERIANIQSLAAGTGLNTSSVTGDKIASYRISRQNNTTNSSPTTARIETGWGYIQGNNTANMSKVVTFSSAFTSAPIVMVSFAGYANSAPTTNSNLQDNGTYIVTPQGIINTTFTVNMTRSASTYTSTFWYVYNWVAIGS